MIAPSCDSWLSFSDRHERRVTNLVVSTYVLDQCLEQIGGDVSVVDAIESNASEPKKRKKE